MADTDGDGLTDGEEIKEYGTDPFKADIDNDRLNDSEEIDAGTDPAVADTDMDGFNDKWEIENGFNPATFNSEDVAGWWQFNRLSGTTAVDSSPYENDGSISGPVRVETDLSRGLRFDGTDDEVSIPGTEQLHLQQFTTAARISFSDLYGNNVTGNVPDGTMMIAAQPNSGDGYAWLFYKTKHNALAVRVENADSGRTATMKTPPGFTVPSSYYRLALTFDGTELTFYVNGEKIDAVDYDSDIDYGSSAILIGHGGGSENGRFNGTLDDFLILNKPLSASEVQALDNAVDDSDNDGIANAEEMNHNTDPREADTDGDGLTDGEEINLYNTDPLETDTDSDGLSDSEEIAAGADPHLIDTDMDGLDDKWEVDNGFNPSDIPADALAGWWTLDEVQNGVAADSSNAGNNGVVDGAAAVEGVIYGALAFDGSDDSLTVNNSDAYKPAGELSILAYAGFDSLYGNTVSGSAEDGTMTLIAQKNSADGHAYTLYKTARNALAVELSSPAAGKKTVIKTAPGFTVPQSWYRIAVVFDRPEVKLYVNGELAAAGNHDAALEYADNTGLKIGCPGAADGGFFAGTLDEIRIYRQALSPEQITGLNVAVADNDNDGVSNYIEHDYGTGAHTADTDNDGLTDAEEINIHNTDPLNPDTDSDGISDDWEIKHELDPLSASDTAEDPDGDGLTNLEEFIAGSDPYNTDTDGDGLSDYEEVENHGTDPADSDTDGDAMPDSWEVQNNTDPAAEDGQLDPDGDHLVNLDEYKAGTDPHDPDTDGDGISDGEEVKYAHTDPLEPLFDGSHLDIARLDGSDFSAALGTWHAEGSDAVSDDRRGWLEYKVDLPRDATCRVEVTAEHAPKSGIYTGPEPVNTSEIMLYADGLFNGRRTLNAPEGSEDTVVAYTPRMKAGEHTLRVRWNNVHFGVELHVRSIDVTVPTGPDTDNDGIYDWEAGALQNVTSLEAQPGTAVEDSYASYVSPLCIEGRALYPTLLDVTAGSSDVQVNRGTAARWYADVTLSGDSATPVKASFQNGARTVTADITWKKLNLLAADSPGSLTIRSGDALRLAAAPADAEDGTVNISVNGKTLSHAPGEAVTHTFDSSGTTTVTGTYIALDGSRQSGSLEVNVLGGSFPESSPACLFGIKRTWNAGDWSDDVVFDTDHTVDLNHEGSDLSLKMKNITRSHSIVARIGENGAIIDSIPLDGFLLQAAVDGYMWVQERYEDGSERWQQEVFERKLPESVDIRIYIIISGVTFVDLTTRRQIDHDDFDLIGMYTFDMLRDSDVTTSTCHRLKCYQDGKFIGDSYYHQKHMPEEENL